MPFNGSGTYTLPAGNPVTTGTTISSTTTNNTNTDIATALTNCVTRDGQSPSTANLPMGGFKLTNLAAGTSAGDSVRYEQVPVLSSSSSNPGASGNVLISNGTNWESGVLPSQPTEIVYETRTSNTILGASDGGKYINITSGTFTQTFNSCANLGANWTIYLRNSGSGIITLDPYGTETIDGLSSFAMYPNEIRIIISDGTNLQTLVLAPFSMTVASTMTFITPPGYGFVSGMIWGGGGSGSKLNNSPLFGSGGGGGACALFTLPSGSLSSSFSITIGAGGAAQTTANTAGNNGNNSTFGSYITGYGGAGGTITESPTNYIVGGGGGGLKSAASGGVKGEPDIYGFGGGTGYSTAVNSANIHDSVYGGGSGGNGGTTPGEGGWSYYGGAGGAGYNKSTTGSSVLGGAGGISASNGTAPGGGGGGSSTATSGAGGNGQCKVWGII